MEEVVVEGFEGLFKSEEWESFVVKFVEVFYRFVIVYDEEGLVEVVVEFWEDVRWIFLSCNDWLFFG